MFGCLSVCATAARAIAAAGDKPLVGVHHMQAHALTPLLTETVPPEFPFLTLLVSGGHTQLVLAERWDSFRILMTTLDNAIGCVRDLGRFLTLGLGLVWPNSLLGCNVLTDSDAFDKTARLLKLPHSDERGLGPVLEEYAAAAPLPPYDVSPIAPLAKPLTRNREKSNVAFSFAGLVTATERAARLETDTMEGDLDAPLAVQQEIARAFQTAAVGHVVDKIRQCIAAHKLDVRGLVVSGGVGSNQHLREE